MSASSVFITPTSSEVIEGLSPTFELRWALVLSNDLLIDRLVDVIFFYNQVDERLQFWVRYAFYFSEVGLG